MRVYIFLPRPTDGLRGAADVTNRPFLIRTTFYVLQVNVLTSRAGNEAPLLRGLGARCIRSIIGAPHPIGRSSLNRAYGAGNYTKGAPVTPRSSNSSLGANLGAH
ncbi:hypothetical protein CRG98_042736 [Punica granatum]|uniref:Uncharacterized protein n=1 Tax=Punica granatum TaxID=22663 RepID=A0A2I0HYM2_PUNGR|nr:hypothetical protein CRG98_042736 [Punica granatum]